MKVYLAVPLQKNRNNILANEISKILLDFNYQVISQWVLWDDPNPNLGPKEIYDRNREAIKSCDLVIAEVSNPSIGVGMEIMFASTLKKKIICIYSKTEISNMLKGLPNVILLRYDDLNNLIEKLRSGFLQLHSKN